MLSLLCVLPLSLAHTSWITVHGLVAITSFNLLKTVYKFLKEQVFKPDLRLD